VRKRMFGRAWPIIFFFKRKISLHTFFFFLKKKKKEQSVFSLCCKNNFFNPCILKIFLRNRTDRGVINFLKEYKTSPYL
jgi:hypothetical protein